MPLLSRVRGLVGKALAPVLSQGVTAGTSLLLQVIAARTLGLVEFGAFALFLGLLTSASALYTGYVGDSLAVLDRHDPAVRSSLVSSALAGWVFLFVLGSGAALIVLGGKPTAALIYAVMLVCWMVRDTLRRLLIARLRFWDLVFNDVLYLVITMVSVGTFALLLGRSTLSGIFAAMSCGAVVAALVGVLRLPHRERTRLRPGTKAMRQVASFGVWRCLQAALRPTALLGSRVLVAHLLSLAAVGLLEAGRLVVAPLQVVINGAGSFLLGGFAEGERSGDRTAQRHGHYAVWALVATTLVGGGVLSLFAVPLGRLLTGQDVSPLLVFGWVVYLAVWAAGLPYVTEVVARRMSREVFLVRVVDSVVGLVLVAGALLIGGGLSAVPWLMSIGGGYSVWRMRRLAISTR